MNAGVLVAGGKRGLLTDPAALCGAAGGGQGRRRWQARQGGKASGVLRVVRTRE